MADERVPAENECRETVASFRFIDAVADHVCARSCVLNV